MINLIAALFLLTGLAQAETFNAFFFGFEKEYFLNPIYRPKTLSDSVRVSEFSVIDRVLSPTAVATYNDKLNLVSLDKSHLDANGIKDARLILGKDNKYNLIATIFHEIGHAELDVFIEQKKDASDHAIMSFYDLTLKDFYKKYFPGFNPKAILHEHFGYYRSNLIEFYSEEISNIYLNNGFNRFKKTCFLNPMLRKKLAEGISSEEFVKVFEIEVGKDFYRKTISPDYVFVRGKDLHLKAPQIPQAPIDQIHLLFWGYHQDYYGFPMNQKELVRRMNQRSPFQQDIADCRMKLWNESRGN